MIAIGLRPIVAVAKDLGHRPETPGGTTVGHKEVTVFVVSESPLVGTSHGVDLEFMSDRVNAPDGGLDVNSFIFRSAGLAHPAGVEHSVAAVKPAIISPEK